MAFGGAEGATGVCRRGSSPDVGLELAELPWTSECERADSTFTLHWSLSLPDFRHHLPASTILSYSIDQALFPTAFLGTLALHLVSLTGFLFS